MSIFSAVDDADDPGRALSYLDHTARSATGMKHYAAAVHAAGRHRGLVLDLGCGAGHDLLLLDAAGARPVGLDPSAVLLAAARARDVHAPLVRSVGEALPMAAGSLAGCRVERVLIHVPEPDAVLREVVRCLRPGGLLTVLEPDWSHFRVRESGGDVPAAWIAPVRHSSIGADLWALVEATGLVVLDRVEELSVWRSLSTLERVIDLPAAIGRSVDAGRIHRIEADLWIERQQERDRRGDFRSTIPKVMVVAQKP
jgi:SAM-dependent methyltransferase